MPFCQTCRKGLHTCTAKGYDFWSTWKDPHGGVNEGYCADAIVQQVWAGFKESFRCHTGGADVPQINELITAERMSWHISRFT